MTRNPPHRDPGRRGPPPEGVYRRRRKPSGTKKPRPEAPRKARDPIIHHGAAGYEGADYLQKQAEGAGITSHVLTNGEEYLFGVSGWIVAAVGPPLPQGYSRLSEIEAGGFRVVSTPHLGRPGHVTILLTDPVDDEQARRFNATFGRFEEE